MQQSTIAGAPLRVPDRRTAPVAEAPLCGWPVPALLGLRELARLRSAVAASWHTFPPLLQQRAHHRVRYAKPVLVTPLDDRSGEPLASPLEASGHDISLTGMSFMHEEPLACRLVAVRFPASEVSIDAVLTRLNWCRFTRDGLYQSGGLFVRAVRLTE
jgi:hypothetical protein